jgi:hypothetical protein
MLSRKAAVAALIILIAMVIGAIAFRRPRSSTLTLMGGDAPGTVVFALTNGTGAPADYSCRIEVKIADYWQETRLWPSILWQRPSYRDKLAIEPSAGVHFCIQPEHISWFPEGTEAWRLRVTWRTFPTAWEERRLKWALQLQPRLPGLAALVRPDQSRSKQAQNQTPPLYGPPMRGTNVIAR